MVAITTRLVPRAKSSPSQPLGEATLAAASRARRAKTAPEKADKASGPRPVVKWAGGKWKLLDQLEKRMPSTRFGTYAEPFAGGAAMFFALADAKRFERARLADKNVELVALYQAIKNDVEALVARLRDVAAVYAAMDEDARSAFFYAERQRKTEDMSAVERGARLLFLNKTCFNGLWRVNSKGVFNTPFGRYDKPRILDEELLRAAHRAFQKAEIVNEDFEAVLKGLGPADFVYFDPPYMPVSKTANFTAYAADGFGMPEQERLAERMVELRERGVRAMLSNGASPEVEALYRRHRLHVDRIQARRSINSDASKRGEVVELVVTTYDETGRVRKADATGPRASSKMRAARVAKTEST